MTERKGGGDGTGDTNRVTTTSRSGGSGGGVSVVGGLAEPGTAMGLRIPKLKRSAINVVKALTENGDWDRLTSSLTRFAELGRERVDSIWTPLKSGGDGRGSGGKALDYEALLTAVDRIANDAGVCHASSLHRACEKLGSALKTDHDRKNGRDGGGSGDGGASDRAVAKARAEHYAELVSDLSERLAAFETQAEALSGALSFPARDLFHASSSSSTDRAASPADPGSSSAVAVVARLHAALELLYDVYGTAVFVLIGGADAADAPAPVLENEFDRLEELLELLTRGEQCCVGLSMHTPARTIRGVADLVSEMIDEGEDAEDAETNEIEARSALALLKADVEQLAVDVSCISSKDVPLPNVPRGAPPGADKKGASVASDADSTANSQGHSSAAAVKDDGAEDDCAATATSGGDQKVSGAGARGEPQPWWLQSLKEVSPTQKVSGEAYGTQWLQSLRELSLESVVSSVLLLFVLVYVYIKLSGDQWCMWKNESLSSSHGTIDEVL